MTNNTRLRELMDEYGLSRSDVCRLARSPRSTVDSWLAPIGKKSHRPTPDKVIALLLLEVEGK